MKMELPFLSRFAVILVLACVIATTADAGPLQNAQSAYRKKDYATALRLYQPLAEEGNRSAQAALAIMYEQGHGVEKNLETAQAWYGKAAAKGHRGAKRALLRVGRELRRQAREKEARHKANAKSYERFKEAAENGDPSAMYNLAHAYETGQGVPRDISKAIHWYRMSAEGGEKFAQRHLGLRYRDGRDVGQDYALARKWLRKAAEQGVTDAQIDLGTLHLFGQGVPPSRTEAKKWFKLAAPIGNANSILTLARVYEKGRSYGHPHAVRWSRVAITLGVELAPHEYGLMYQGGLIVPQDHKEAARWYELGARQGNNEARYGLGVAYVNGSGVDQDFAKAAVLFRPAAGEGHAGSLFMFGLLHHIGGGVPQDDVEALFWIELSLSRASAADLEITPEMLQLRDKIRPLITTEQHALVRERVRNWKPD